MVNKKRRREVTDTPTAGASRSPSALPRRALERINLGQAFAEYDNNLAKRDVFVRTPAMLAALDHQSPQYIFVGRRGAGKTTIVKYLEENQDRVISIRPEIFSPNNSFIDIDLFKDMAQRPFRSLVAAFRRSLQDEALFVWLNGAIGRVDQVSERVHREYADNGEFDFDIRTVRFIAALTRPLRQQDEVAWLTEVKVAKKIASEMPDISGRGQPYSIVIDAIDDFWDGTMQAVYYLTALLHAALEINSQVSGVRVLVFLRENMFERVRTVDSEFSRLETCVVGLDWTTNQLREMIERRVNAPLPSKLELGGKTWDAFFEDGEAASEAVFGFCQSRPRDVLTYCTLALTTAQSNRHTRVMLEDLQEARRRFSDNRLKDLSDEYQENYPQIGLVLSRFWGLGAQFTLGGFEDFLHKLTEDAEIVSGCGTWIFQHNSPEMLARLLYNIGFVGLAVMPGHVGRDHVTTRSDL
ncbi:MAG: P-loop ATPase, Sll1717 family [Actinomycetota bacterium]